MAIFSGLPTKPAGPVTLATTPILMGSAACTGVPATINSKEQVTQNKIPMLKSAAVTCFIASSLFDELRPRSLSSLLLRPNHCQDVSSSAINQGVLSKIPYNGFCTCARGQGKLPTVPSHATPPLGGPHGEVQRRYRLTAEEGPITAYADQPSCSLSNGNRQVDEASPI